MPDPDLIGPPPGTTPAELAASRGRRRALPDDLIREASRRLGVMSLLAAIIWVVARPPRYAQARHYLWNT